jgi:hypothetical protein
MMSHTHPTQGEGQGIPEQEERTKAMEEKFEEQDKCKNLNDEL